MPRRCAPTEARPGTVRREYETRGVEEFYAESGGDYRNPHEDALRAALFATVPAWRLDLTHVLDLACGSGEATLALRELGAVRVDGIDPYTGAAYLARTRQTAEPLDFTQIEGGALTGRRYSLIACTYALHLCLPSRLPRLLYALGQVSDSLLIATPHKRPEIRPEWGWSLQQETVLARVRLRFYRFHPLPPQVQ